MSAAVALPTYSVDLLSSVVQQCKNCCNVDVAVCSCRLRKDTVLNRVTVETLLLLFLVEDSWSLLAESGRKENENSPN